MDGKKKEENSFRKATGSKLLIPYSLAATPASPDDL